MGKQVAICIMAVFLFSAWNIPITGAYLTDIKSIQVEVLTMGFSDAIDISVAQGTYILNKKGQIISDKDTMPVTITISNKLMVGMDVQATIHLPDGIVVKSATNSNFYLEPGQQATIILEKLDGKLKPEDQYSGTVKLDLSLTQSYQISGDIQVSFKGKSNNS